MARPVEMKAKNLGYASITIRINQEAIDKLNEYCKKKGLVRSEFIREAILKAINT